MAIDSVGILPYRPAPTGPAGSEGSAGADRRCLPDTQARARHGRYRRGEEPGADKEPLAAAVREFAEELGCPCGFREPCHAP
jgi:hypothetical protein